MTLPFNPYASLDLEADPQHAAEKNALQSSLFVASQRPPADRWARVLDLAGKTKLPTAVVDRNFDVVDAAVTRQAPDPAALVRDHPGLATWLQDPDNATVAKTELAPLARVARGSALLATNGPQGRSGFENVGRAARSGYNDLIAAAGQLGVAYGLLAPDEAAAVVADANARTAQFQKEAPPYVASFDAAMQAQSRRGAIYGALGQFTQGASTIGEVLDVIGTYLAHPRGAIYRGVEGLAQSAPALALGASGAADGAAIGTVVPGVGNAVGGTVGLVTGTFLGMAPINVGSEINGELAKRGIDITKPDALARAYADPTLMSTLRATAERKGLTSAAVSALVASVAGKFTAEARAAGASTGAIARATAADAGIQAAGQAGAELAGQVAGAKGDVSKANLSEALQAGVNMLGYSIGETAIGASRRALLHNDPAIAAEGLHAGSVDALRAGHDAQALAELGDAIKEAPTVSSVPARMQQLVDIASGGDGAASVFFRDGDWDSYWQTKGASPAKAASDILGDGGKAYYEAKATGAPLEIPLGDYAAKVGTTEHYDALLPIARTRPDGMSLSEAHEYLQSLPATMQELAREATSGEKPEGTPPKEDTALQVGENVAEQLKKAGIAPTVAKQEAALYESTFRTLGERLGVDPLELFNKYQLTIGRGEEPSGEPTPAAAAPTERPVPVAASEMQALEQPGATARGRIRFGEQGQVAIDLFTAADRSTFLHETGHFYLKLLDDVAKADIAPAELKADHATIRDWLGATEGEAFTRAQHEQFARGFEAYLMEGKAPSLKLREAFYRFKRWLTNLYQKAQSLDVTLSPDVRAVFDRLLASRDEIAQAEQVQNVAPLFTDPKAIGMTPEQAESYQRAIGEAHQAAEEELTQKMMREIKREESAQWKQWRDPIEKEIEQQLNDDPRYKALALLQRGTKPDGTPLKAGSVPIKLYREAVIASYGKELYTQLPKGVTANHVHPNVVNPNIAADMLGFRNGRELVEALAGLPPKDVALAQLTDARMQAEHGERLSPNQVRDQAAAAVHNEKRIQVLRKELEHLASDHLATLKGLVRTVTRKVPPTEVVKEQADRIIGARTVKDVKPHLYELAAARAATAAREALLAGDIEGAYRAKHQELLATAVFNSATEARASIDAALDEFRDVFGRGKADATLAKSRDMDLVNATRAILASVGVGKTDKPAAAYLEQLKRYDPETYSAVQELVDAAGAVSATGSGDYKKLSFDDFTDLRETVASLWTLARRTRQIEIDGQKLDRAAITESLGASVAEITQPGPRAGYQRAVTAWDKTQMKLLGVRASLRRVEHWVRAMDGGADAGVFRKYVWNPVSEGITAYRLAKREAIARYAEIVKPLKGSVSRDAIPAPELGYTFRDKAELLGAMLHVGNESNLSKLLRGRGWGAVDEQGVLDRSRWEAFVDRLHKDGTLTKPDYDYLQGVWDLFDELKAGAQRAHKELYGHYFSEVTADAVETPFGTYKGGYAPAKADPFIAADAQIRADREALEHSDNSFMFPTAGRGFTKARVEQYAKPLILDVGLVPSHLDAVLRFTHIEPRVRDVGRVIMDRGFREQLDAFDPTVGGDMLVPWLQRAALQRIELSSKGWGGRAADTFFRELRNRTGLQIFTANVVVTAEQLTHFPSVFVKVKPSAIGAALWRYVRQPKELASAIAEKSDFMKTRESAALMEVQHAIDNIMLKRGVTDQFRDFAKEHGQFLMRGVQSVMDHVTWSAAYEEAAAKGLGEQEAVRHADSVIREALGSFAPEDLSRFETGTPFQRFFSMAYSFYNTKANMLTSEVTSTVRNMGLRKGAGRLLYIYTMGFMIPAVLGAAIKQGLSGKPLDEDDDGPWDDVAAHFFGSQLEMGMRAIPIAGPVVQTAVNAFDNKPQNDDIATSPAVHAIEAAAHAPGDVYHAIHERMITTKEITDLFTLLGLASGLPIRPLAKPVGYLHDVSTGAAEPTSRADFARGLVTGARGSR